MKLLFLAGSSRKASWNKMLARIAYDIAKAEGAEATFIDLKDYPMPIYNGDDEEAQGLPEKAIDLKKLFIEHDGFFIASPEYNSSITPLLKNSLDWISRPQKEDKMELVAYMGKVAAISSASPGNLGGLRSLVVLRMMLGNIGVTVVPKQLAIIKAHEAFGKDGQLIDNKQKDTLAGVVKQLITTTKGLKG